MSPGSAIKDFNFDLLPLDTRQGQYSGQESQFLQGQYSGQESKFLQDRSSDQAGPPIRPVLRSAHLRLSA